MTVSITLSKTLNGSNVSDSLTGGSSGYNFGSSENGDTNPAQLPFYLRHDGAAFIFNLAVYARPYTGTYGGDYSANADFTKLLNHGDAGFGLHVDFLWNTLSPFGVGAYSVFKTNQGTSFSTRFTVPTFSMFYYNGGSPIDASAPVNGELGQSGDSALGDMAKMLFRYMVPAGETQSGKRQFDVVYSYNFT